MCLLCSTGSVTYADTACYYCYSNTVWLILPFSAIITMPRLNAQYIQIYMPIFYHICGNLNIVTALLLTISTHAPITYFHWNNSSTIHLYNASLAPSSEKYWWYAIYVYYLYLNSSMLYTYWTFPQQLLDALFIPCIHTSDTLSHVLHLPLDNLFPYIRDQYCCLCLLCLISHNASNLPFALCSESSSCKETFLPLILLPTKAQN